MIVSAKAMTVVEGDSKVSAVRGSARERLVFIIDLSSMRGMGGRGFGMRR